MSHLASSCCCGLCAGKSQEAKAEWIRGSVVNLVAIPLLPYLAWAVLYYIKVHVPSWHSPSVGATGTFSRGQCRRCASAVWS